MCHDGTHRLDCPPIFVPGAREVHKVSVGLTATSAEDVLVTIVTGRGRHEQRQDVLIKRENGQTVVPLFMMFVPPWPTLHLEIITPRDSIVVELKRQDVIYQRVIPFDV
jgi:hypothetical protein